MLLLLKSKVNCIDIIIIRSSEIIAILFYFIHF